MNKISVFVFTLLFSLSGFAQDEYFPGTIISDDVLETLRNSFENTRENVNKYGLVPTSAMPDTWQSENTSAMSKMLCTKLREDGLKLRSLAKMRMHEGKKKEAKIMMP